MTCLVFVTAFWFAGGMRLAAIGDAHLGRSYLPVTTAGGVNQREVDFERSFEAAVDLALVQQPDLVVWLGDIFDHPRPTYRSYRVAQRGLTRVREHGLKAVVISGNHDTPRLPGTGSPYSTLADTFPEMHFAHRLAYERFELEGLVVHAVPQMMTVGAALEALDEAARRRDAGKTNLLLTHPRLIQLQPRHSDINEIEVDAGRLLSDLVLLVTTTRSRPCRTPCGTPDRQTPSRSLTTRRRLRGSSCSTPTAVSAGTSRWRGVARW